MNTGYDGLDAVAMADLVASGEAHPGELLDLSLERVAAVNPQINAVVMIPEEVDRRHIAQGLPGGPLRSVPFLLKDLGCEAVEFPCNNVSRSLAMQRCLRASAIHEKIRGAGLVTFGQTTAPEAGIGPASVAAVYGGPTRNPWDLGRTPPDHRAAQLRRSGPASSPRCTYSPFTAAFNASGQPAASVPLAWSRGGLPIDIHLGARFGGDETLVAPCAELEAARPWFAECPPLVRAA